MVSEKVPSPTESSPDASDVTAEAKSGKSFTGEEAWLLFAKVKIENFTFIILFIFRRKRTSTSERSRL